MQNQLDALNGHTIALPAARTHRTLQLTPTFAFNIPLHTRLHSLLLTPEQLETLFLQEASSAPLLRVPLQDAASISITLEFETNATSAPIGVIYAFSALYPCSPHSPSPTFRTRALLVPSPTDTEVSASLLKNLKKFLAMLYTWRWIRAWAQNNGVPFKVDANVGILGQLGTVVGTVEWDCPTDTIYLTFIYLPNFPNCPLFRVPYSVCTDPNLLQLEHHLQKIAHTYHAQQLLDISC